MISSENQFPLFGIMLYRCACSGSNGDADRRYCSDGFLVGLVFAGWWWDLLARRCAL